VPACDWGACKAAPRPGGRAAALRHLVLPVIAIGLTLLLVLPPAQRHIIVLFAALPTASSAYVLASRMGGDGSYVAGLVTLSTLVGMVSVPFWLAVIERLPL
jgi:malonate transporter